MAAKSVILAALSLFTPLARTQAPPAAEEFSTGFNSSFTLTPSQIKAAQLDDVMVESIENIMNFDRSQMAFGGPLEDDFYTVPPRTNETGTLLPGQVLKVQPFTEPTAYSIPPNTALSRIMYTTANVNGTVIPTSGFILWPYTPRKVEGRDPKGTDKASVVIWNHGTSGFFTPQAPSAHRGLWYDDGAPFALAEAGYAVFAPDYAGLGISTSWDGSFVPHQYSAYPTTARDGLYGLRAALEAFPGKLDEEFVTIGHSQGGGASWATAEVLASDEEFADLLPGYKGSIAASPGTRVFSIIPQFIIPTVGLTLNSIFPSFTLDEWLTPLGIARLNLVKEIQGGVGVWMQLFTSVDIDKVIKPNYNESWYDDAFSKLGDAGRRDFAGPLLVLQGTADSNIPYDVTSKAVEDTLKLYPDNDLEILLAPGVGHTPVLRATKHHWLQWIQDRFESKPVAKGDVRTELDSLLPIDRYLTVDTSFPGWAGLPQYSYQVPLAV